MSKHYKIILAVRFIGYLLFFIGLTIFVFMLGPLIQAELKYRIDKISGVKRTVVKYTAQAPSSPGPTASPQTSEGGGFGSLTPSENEQSSYWRNEIVPVSTEFGIVIEKIDANAKIIANVNPANEAQYVSALKEGVAEALGSTPPGEPGNLYLFSHSTDAPWNIVRFNAIFYLLRELEAGDKVIIFYKNRRYDYVVFDKLIVHTNDVSYLTNRYDSPVLTLQTCDPPGTLINRLIVRAKLVSS